MKNRPRKRGFSLIELLIASVIIASAGALLIGSLIGANRSAELRVHQAVSVELLASQLALLADRLPPDGPTQGTLDPPGEGSGWVLTQQPTPLPGLMEVHVAVTHHEQDVDVVTYRRALAQP